MVKFEFTQIGEFHINHNEDFLVSHEIGKDKMMIAVMDGCTMGTESHFASVSYTHLTLPTTPYV